MALRLPPSYLLGALITELRNADPGACEHLADRLERLAAEPGGGIHAEALGRLARALRGDLEALYEDTTGDEG